MASGLFLIYKAVTEIHGPKHLNSQVPLVIARIAGIDIIFSLYSINRGKNALENNRRQTTSCRGNASARHRPAAIF